MKSFYQKSFALLVALVLISVSTMALAKRVPVSMIMQVQGQVEYSKNGTKWKKVRRNKLLFAGYMIKTGANGSAKVVNQKSGKSRDLGPNSEIKIAANGAELVAGSLSAPSDAGSNLLAGLQNRFAKAQRYTTVRRSVNKPKKLKLATARNLTLSGSFPDMVWENLGADYSYRLIIDGTTHEVSGTTEPFVRHTVSALSAGKHSYSVEVVKAGKTVYAPRRSATLTWLSDAETDKIQDGLTAIKKTAPGDQFLVGSYLDDKGLTVAAMDEYREYFAANPDDNDMRPMLIMAYHELKLKGLKKKEALTYNEMLNEE